MKLTVKLRKAADKTSNIITKAVLKEAADRIEQLENENQRLLDKFNSEAGLK